MIGFQVLVLFVGGRAFSITPLNGAQWAYSIVIGVLSIPAGALIKLVPLEAWARICRRFFKPKVMPELAPPNELAPSNELTPSNELSGKSEV
jgi:Ca2+-transporting ATPase